MRKIISRTQWPKSRVQLFFLLCLSVVCICNVFVLRHEIVRLLAFNKDIPHQIIGYEFLQLENAFKDVEIIGYYTDGDLSEKKHGKLFAHAQYILAPTILDLNSLNHEYILFVCSSEEIAWKKIKEIGAVALQKNPWGMILAKRKRWTRF